MSITVGDIRRVMDTIAPFSSCMEWDNVGLLIGAPESPVSGIVVALDVTRGAIEEAKRRDANCIVSHHPVIFNALKRLSSSSVPALCLQNGISVISAHTNYDFAPKGVNYALASALGLQNIRPFGPRDTARPYLSLVVFVPKSHIEPVYEAMSAAGAGQLGNYSHCGFLSEGEGRFLPQDGAHPFLGSVGAPEKAEEIRLEMICPPEKLSAVVAAMHAAHPYEEPAWSVFENKALLSQTVYGMIGELPQALPCEELALCMETALETHIQYTPVPGLMRTVAVCGGAGAEYFPDAQSAGADAFLTGEVKHHEWFAAADAGLCLMAGGHHATEHIAMPQLAAQLQEAFPALPIALYDSNPVDWAE